MRDDLTLGNKFPDIELPNLDKELDIVRQLTTIFRSKVATRRNDDSRKAANDLYSEVATIAGPYFDFTTIGGAALDMTAAARRVTLSSNDKEQILKGMLSLPPHPDVPHALKRLQDAGLRLVTLTNSTPRAVEEQLKHAGIEKYFERKFSVDSVRKYKPAPETYRMVAKELNVTTSGLRMVAAHAWDIVGAMQTGCAAAFVARPGKVLNPLAGRPDIVGADLRAVAEEIIRVELPENSRPAFA